MTESSQGESNTSEQANRTISNRGTRVMMFVRIAIGLLLLGYVLWGVDFSDIKGLTTGIEPLWLIVFIGTLVLSVMLCVWKWQLLLRLKGYDQSGWSLLGMYVLGQFFSNVLPTAGGGDVARGLALKYRIHDGKIAVASIIVERLTGLTVLLALTCLLLLVSPKMRADRMLDGLVLLTVAAYVAFVIAVIDRRLLGWWRRILGRWKLCRNAFDKVSDFQEAIWAYRHFRVPLIGVFALSVLFYVGVFIHVFAACRMIGQPVPFLVIVGATLSAQTVSVLPLSINGIGLMEWAFVTVFSAFSLSPAVGLTIMLLVRLAAILWSCLGYLVYLFSHAGRAVHQGSKV